MYCDNYEDFIIKKQYNKLLNENINMIKNKYCSIFNNGQSMLMDLKNFNNNEINIKNLRNFLIWTCFNITYDYYNNVYDIILNHYNILNDYILLENNIKKNTKKIVKKEIEETTKEKNIKIKDIEKTKKNQYLLH
jgi:hypothetical protein